MNRIARTLATATTAAACVGFILVGGPAQAAPYDRVQVGQTRAEVRHILHAPPIVLARPYGTGFGKREVIYYQTAPATLAFVTFFKPRGYHHFVVIAKTLCQTATGDLVCS